MTELYDIDGEILVLAVGLSFMAVVLATLLRLLHTSWPRLIATVLCVVSVAIVIYLPVANAKVTLCLACIPMVFVLMMFPDQTELRRLWWRMTGDERAATAPESIATASIISILRPKMDRVLAAGGEAIIVGGDGYPAGDTSYPWFNYVKDLLDRGCKLTQYVVAPTEEAKRAFEQLQSHAKKTQQGEFHYRQLADPSKVADENDRHLIGMLTTYHPTLAWNDKGERMLWLESHHPASSTSAFGCKYYSPECLAADRRPFDEKVALLRTAWAATENAATM